jgi:hypothetical protein
MDEKRGLGQVAFGPVVKEGCVRFCSGESISMLNDNVSGGNQLRVYTMETSILSTDLASDGSLYRWVILTY